MKLEEYEGNIEKWFLSKKTNDFPDGGDYVSKYNNIKSALQPIHKLVTSGADATDGTSLTWHDESHINKVISQASKLLSYTNANITAYETFVLLVAIQIHDIKNIEGREEHESRAITIFHDLGIAGLVDSILLKNIGFIANCHAGSMEVGGVKEKDKIHFLRPMAGQQGSPKVLHLRFLAAVLRLADEYADDSERAMSHLLKIGKIKKGSIIHQKHAECLHEVTIIPDTGIINFDYHLDVKDAVVKFPKYDKEKDMYEDQYLLDEIFIRTVKSHYETVYCMRYLRPYVNIDKLHINIELEHADFSKQMAIVYELEEKGYPNDHLEINGLVGDKLKYNGKLCSGETLNEYIVENKLLQD